MKSVGGRITVGAMLAVLFGVAGASWAQRLFPMSVQHNEWVQFSCAEMAGPVVGIIYEPNKPTCCGVPLGGMGTGCLDIEVGGVLGFETLFTQFPRQPQLLRPFLGVSVGGKTHVLADPKYLKGGLMEGCVEPCRTVEPAKGRDWNTTLCIVKGVSTPKQIHYFGHYPVADVEYELEAPLAVSLRAWAPFVPGDVGASTLPALVWEVRLKNEDTKAQSGTVAVTFPGFPAEPNFKGTYQREAMRGNLTGVAVNGPKRMGYVLGVLKETDVRMGDDLNRDTAAWAEMEKGLPAVAAEHSGASCAVPFALEAGQEKVVRFVLAWYAPEVVSSGDPNNPIFTNYYATRYNSAAQVAGRMAAEHKELLRQTLAWQQVIYGDKSLPPYLKDGLIQTLCLIPETSYWLAAQGPLGDWCFPDGYFAMNESPRGCSQIECIPCTYYGGIPITYFFPQLARTTLRAYTHMLSAEGAAPFDLGPCCAKVGFITPMYKWQKALNGVCYVTLVDRLWQVTGDRSVLEEFYDGVKRTTEYTVKMSANYGKDAVVSIPDDCRSEWWEGFDWYGMTCHAGALRVSNMAIALRMAEAMKDEAFAKKCRQWLKEGKASLEDKMWNDKVGSYLLYKNEAMNKINDTIMANQFDGEWNNDFHGLPGLFKPKRVHKALGVIKQSCVAPFGAVSFARAEDLQPLVTYGIFPPEIMMLGFTYMYEGDRETGLSVLEKCLRNLFITHGNTWDLPNMVSGSMKFTEGAENQREGFHVDTTGFGDGRRTYGTDYYQNMMLWAAPAALAGTDITGPCRTEGLVNRIMQASRRN